VLGFDAKASILLSLSVVILRNRNDCLTRSRALACEAARERQITFRTAGKATSLERMCAPSEPVAPVKTCRYKQELGDRKSRQEMGKNTYNYMAAV
jgi:hypothetical protein